MSSIQNTILKSLFCVLILISTTQFSFLEKSSLESEILDSETNNLVLNPSISPISTVTTNKPKEELPLEFRNIKIRKIDEEWAKLLFKNHDEILQEALEIMQDLIEERSP